MRGGLGSEGVFGIFLAEFRAMGGVDWIGYRVWLAGWLADRASIWATGKKKGNSRGRMDLFRAASGYITERGADHRA